MSVFQCFIKIDKTIVYNTDDCNSTVIDLKNFIWDRTGIHPSTQILKYGCRILNDKDLLKDKVIRDGVIQVIMRIIDKDNGYIKKDKLINSNN